MASYTLDSLPLERVDSTSNKANDFGVILDHKLKADSHFTIVIQGVYGSAHDKDASYISLVSHIFGCASYVCSS